MNLQTLLGPNVDPAMLRALDPRMPAYLRALKGFDWTFAMSDDPRVVEAGRRQRDELWRMQVELDPDGHIWRWHMPGVFGVPAPKVQPIDGQRSA